MRGWPWRFASLTSATMGAALFAAACDSGNGGGLAGGMGGAATTASTGGSTATSMSTGGSGGAPGGPNGIAAWCAGHASTGSSGSSSSGGGAPGALVFSVDVCKGPARQYQPPAGPTPVSEHVYGINAGSFVATSTKWGLIRQGGDDDSAYNWTNDYSNSGADFCYYQGLSTKNGNLAGRYTDPTGDTIPAALAKGEAFLATVPILDYVAAAYGRNTGWDTATNAGDVCPGTDPLCSGRSGQLSANVVDKSQGDPNFNSTLKFAYANDGSATPTGSPAFIPNVMSKGSAFCSCPAGTKTCAGCTVGTSPVAQDELVNFLKVNYGAGGAPVFFDLDNEPNYWVGTHPELYPNDCSVGSVPWDDVATRNINAATAIKKAWSTAKVFGPVVSGDGMAYGGDYMSPHFVAGVTEFSDWYLAQVAAASVKAGEQLLDVFDVHYYTVGHTDAECLESPRLFWDPNATDISAAETNSLDFNYGDHDYWDQYWYPRQVIPRLFKKMAAAYSGQATPLPGLSFSEYNPGCETAISGGVAEADLLGIFGREGAFAAMAWPLQGASGNYLVAAYDLYRNYDGAGSVVGDTAVRSTTTDTRNTSVYAFTHADDAASVEVVAVNKQGTAQAVTLQIASSPSFHTATLYNLVPGNAAVTAATGSAPSVTCASGACTLALTLPATSATTIILR
jgi:Glycoside hydrolase family 44